MRTNNRRKLIKHTKLKELTTLSELGVPTMTLIREHNLDISGPHLNKLIDLFKLLDSDEVTDTGKLALRQSLFPSWLKNEIDYQPDNYSYLGRFPWGQWCKKESA